MSTALAILMNLLEDTIVLFRPRIRHHACSRSPGARLPSRWGPRQPLLGTDDPHLDLDLLALGHAQVFVGFNGIAVDFSVQCLGHGGFLLIVLRGFAPLSPGLGHFIAATARADSIIVLGFDLLLVGQVRKIQAALFIDRLALLIQTGTAALPQPVQQVHVATGAVLAPHGHTFDQCVGEPLDPPQNAGLTQGGLLLSFLLVGGRTPSAMGCLEEVFGEPVGQKPPRLVGNGEELLEKIAVVDALVFWVLAEVGTHILLALPTFEWVKNSVQTSAMGARNPEESAIFRALDRVEFESSAVKEDGRLQMLPIAEAIRVFLREHRADNDSVWSCRNP